MCEFSILWVLNLIGQLSIRAILESIANRSEASALNNKLDVSDGVGREEDWETEGSWVA